LNTQVDLASLIREARRRLATGHACRSYLASRSPPPLSAAHDAAAAARGHAAQWTRAQGERRHGSCGRQAATAALLEAWEPDGAVAGGGEERKGHKPLISQLLEKAGLGLMR